MRDKSQSIDWKFCGKHRPFAVTFTESSFTVRLYSDNGIEEKGFYARYLLVKQEIDLGKDKNRFQNPKWMSILFCRLRNAYNANKTLKALGIIFPYLKFT